MLNLANGAVDLLLVVIPGFILSAPMFGRVHKYPDNNQELLFPTETLLCICSHCCWLHSYAAAMVSALEMIQQSLFSRKVV